MPVVAQQALQQLGAARRVARFGVDLGRARLPRREHHPVLVALLEQRREERRVLRRGFLLLGEVEAAEALEELSHPGKFSGIFALLRASIGETTLRRTSSVRFWSSVCMPRLWPVWIDEYICATLFSRIRLRMAGVPSMISCAAMRPLPSLTLSSTCEITATSDSDSIA